MWGEGESLFIFHPHPIHNFSGSEKMMMMMMMGKKAMAAMARSIHGSRMMSNLPETILYVGPKPQRFRSQGKNVARHNR